ncbi:MAG: hypothetical protein NXH86_04240 [Flavobacteriaceae bacterium]|nr:hypothetical protein [Flavobacteriaceae bacterium]
MAFIGIFAKFSYVLVMKDAGEYWLAEAFGYRYLSQFLWSLGNEIFAISMGTVLFISTRFFIHTPMKTVFRWISAISIATGLYFMGWIFFQEQFDGMTEVYAAILFSILTTILYVYFLSRLTKVIQGITELTNYFTSKIRLLTDVIILRAPDYVRNQKVWYEDVVDPTMDKLNE